MIDPSSIIISQEEILEICNFIVGKQNPLNEAFTIKPFQSLKLEKEDLLTIGELTEAAFDFYSYKNPESVSKIRSYYESFTPVLDCKPKQVDINESFKEGKNVVARIDIQLHHPEIINNVVDMCRDTNIVTTFINCIASFITGNVSCYELVSDISLIVGTLSKEQYNRNRNRINFLNKLCKNLSLKSEKYDYGYICSDWVDYGLIRIFTISINAKRKTKEIILPNTPEKDKNTKIIIKKYNNLMRKIKRNRKDW